MGRKKRRGRAVTGILLFDKSPGLSSNRALQRVKGVFDAQKAGHTGSLDPLASGLLPICFGEATKISGFLLDSDKCYQVRAKLGEKTETGDAEGEVIETIDVPDDIGSRLDKAAERFRGPIEQTPPMYSAVKHQGKRLYELAREGVEVERAARPVDIHELTVHSVNSEFFSLDVRCSKGTYVRTLVEDLAQAAGTVAHVSELRRSSVGALPDAPIYSFEDLEAIVAEHADSEESKPELVQDQSENSRPAHPKRTPAAFAALDDLLIGPEKAFSGWPKVILDSSSSWYVMRGQPVQVAKAPTRGQVLIHSADDKFLGIGEIDSDGRVAPKRLFVTQKDQ